MIYTAETHCVIPLESTRTDSWKAYGRAVARTIAALHRESQVDPVLIDSLTVYPRPILLGQRRGPTTILLLTTQIDVMATYPPSIRGVPLPRKDRRL